MFDPTLEPITPEEEREHAEHEEMWKLGAAFTEFIRNPSAAAWQSMEQAMRRYQRANKDG